MSLNTKSLTESRMKVAELRNSIRILKHNIESTRFIVECDAIKSVEGNYGKNSEERERFLKNALFEAKDFLSMEDKLISLQNSLEIEEAKIYSLRDERRELELELRQKMIDLNLFDQETSF